MIMISKEYITLEFNQVLSHLADCALSDHVKDKIMNLSPYKDIRLVNRHVAETSHARDLIETFGTPPLASMTHLQKSLELIEMHAMLLPENFEDISQFIASCRRTKQYLHKGHDSNEIGLYGSNLHSLDTIYDEITRCIRNQQVDNEASPELNGLRLKILKLQNKIQEKLNSCLQNNKKYLSENFIITRNGRYALAVKKDYKSKVKGSVIDRSNSGETCFIEPASITKLQSELQLLEIEEDNEVRKILYTLTAMVEDFLPTIKRNIEAMEVLDFIFAKAKLSITMKATEPTVMEERRILIDAGRHPLLDIETAVPLNFILGDDVLHGECFRHLVITGPNTGGKTVALKTVGLLSLMAQCGLHVPAKKSYFSLNSNVLCDIGDGQSITENLSTFSSHITNIIDILDRANNRSLVLLDELGSGTDPTEGMGLATAILEKLASKGCLVVATTHYPEIKDFALHTPGFLNGRMAFDRENLCPLYKLEIGAAGESCALYIADRLGLDEDLIQRARDIAYKEDLPKKDKMTTLDTQYSIDQKHIQKMMSVEDKRLTDLANQKANENNNPPKIHPYVMGDSVVVSPQQLTGIVYKPANDKGMVTVQIQGEKVLVNHKRLTLKVPATELYPDYENYDFSIIFDSVENRKASHKMGKKFCSDLVIEHESTPETI